MAYLLRLLRFHGSSGNLIGIPMAAIGIPCEKYNIQRNSQQLPPILGTNRLAHHGRRLRPIGVPLVPSEASGSAFEKIQDTLDFRGTRLAYRWRHLKFRENSIKIIEIHRCCFRSEEQNKTNRSNIETIVYASRIPLRH